MIFIKLTISENKLVSGWLERVYLPWKYQMTHTIGRCHTPLQWSMAAINWAHHPLTQRCRWCSRGKEDEGASNARHASWKVQLFAHLCAFPTPLKKIMWPQTSAANYQITCCVVASHAINVKYWCRVRQYVALGENKNSDIIFGIHWEQCKFRC